MSTLSPHAAELLAWLRDRTRERQPMPGDSQIANRFRLRSTDDAMPLLRELQEAKLIEVRRTSLGREIALVETVEASRPPRLEGEARAAALAAAAAIPLPVSEPPPPPRSTYIAPIATTPSPPQPEAVAPAPVPAAPPAPEPPVQPPAEEAPAMPASSAITPASKFAERVERLYAEFVRAAEAGEPCPKDADLTRLLGFGKSTLHDAITRLKDTARISVQSVSGRGRIVTIDETGASTAPFAPIAKPAAQSANSTAVVPPPSLVPPAKLPAEEIIMLRARIERGEDEALRLVFGTGTAAIVNPLMTARLDETAVLDLLATGAQALNDMRAERSAAR